MQPWRDTLRSMRDHAITNEIMAKMFRVKESADLYQFSIAHVPATWSMNEDEFKLRKQKFARYKPVIFHCFREATKTGRYGSQYFTFAFVFLLFPRLVLN